MPNQAAKALRAMNGAQINPAFWRKSFSPDDAIWASPPNAPNTLTVTTSGTTNCIRLTPRFPRPAFSASALPFSRLGKKKPMLDMDDAKLPPPKPHSKARPSMIQYGVCGSWTANPIPRAGIIRVQVVSVVQSRPPNTGTMKL